MKGHRKWNIHHFRLPDLTLVAPEKEKTSVLEVAKSGNLRLQNFVGKLNQTANSNKTGKYLAVESYQGVTSERCKWFARHSSGGFLRSFLTRNEIFIYEANIGCWHLVCKLPFNFTFCEGAEPIKNSEKCLFCFIISTTS